MGATIKKVKETKDVGGEVSLKPPTSIHLHFASIVKFSIFCSSFLYISFALKVRVIT